ncbi:MAG: sigma-70 family RNA polymerase sigma factor [Planctomycetota bacterium]
MEPAEEQALIERAQSGDRAALGDLLRGHQQRLYNVCYRMVSHPDDAAELTQDVLLKVVEKISEFRGDAKLTTWMTRVAMNASISHLRKRKLRQTVSINQPPGPGNENADSALAGRLPDPREPGPEACVQQHDMLDELQSAIARLDDDQRAVLVLRDVEELDYHQIAQTLDLPVGTVKSRLFRARLALRQQLNPTASA